MIKLLSFLKDPVFEAASLTISLRMVALALDADQKDMTNELLDFIMDPSIPSSSPILQNIPQGKLERVETLLRRYCTCSDEDLFANLFPSMNSVEISEFMESVTLHRISMLAHLFEQASQLCGGNYKVPEDIVWAAFESGNSNVAKALEKAGGYVAWMDTHRSSFQIATADAAPAQKPEGEGALPAVASSLFRAYGGDQVADIQNSNELEQLLKTAGKQPLPEIHTTEDDTDDKIPEPEPAKEDSMDTLKGAIKQMNGYKRGMLRRKTPSGMISYETHDVLWDAVNSGRAADVARYLEKEVQLGWMEPVSRRVDDQSDVLPSYLQPLSHFDGSKLQPIEIDDEMHPGAMAVLAGYGTS
jgi:hypothetical protein